MLGNCQGGDVLLIWIIVGQMLVVSASGNCHDKFSFACNISVLST